MTELCFWTDERGCVEDACSSSGLESIGRMNLVGANYDTVANGVAFQPNQTTELYPSSEWLAGAGPAPDGDVIGAEYVTNINVGTDYVVNEAPLVDGWPTAMSGSKIHVDLPASLIYGPGTPPLRPGRHRSPLPWVLIYCKMSAYFTTSRYFLTPGVWRLVDNDTNQTIIMGTVDKSDNSSTTLRGTYPGWSAANATDFTASVRLLYLPLSGVRSYPNATLKVDLYLKADQDDLTVPVTTITQIKVRKTYYTGG